MPACGHERTAFPIIGDLPDGRIPWQSPPPMPQATSSTTSAKCLRRQHCRPILSLPQVVGGEAWRRTNQLHSLVDESSRPTQPQLFGHIGSCAPATGAVLPGAITMGADIHALAELHVPDPGEYRVHVWLEDAAGNAREESGAIAARSASIPSLRNWRSSRWTLRDPLRVVVRCSRSSLGRCSGRNRDACQLARPRGTDSRTEREGSLLVAHVDDERFRNGAYEFRARAVDHAGNEASTGRRSDGSAATLRLPARIDTRLAVGVPRTVVRRRAQRRRGSKRVYRGGFDGWIAVSLRGTAGQFGSADSWQTRMGNQSKAPRSRRLRQRADGALVPSGLRRPAPTGSFTTSSRQCGTATLLFRYGGSRRIGSASTDFTLLVPADTSIRARSTTPLEWTAGAVQRTSDDASAAAAAESSSRCRRTSAVAGARSRLSGRTRSGTLALPVPLRRHGRAGDVPIPRSAAGRGRLPLHQWQLTRRQGVGSRALTQLADR